MSSRLRHLVTSLSVLCAVFLTAWAAAADPVAPALRSPAGAIHSPMTRSVVEHLRAVLARGNGRPDVFVKIGDSNTVNTAFMGCFAGEDVKLGEHAALAPTIAHFRAAALDGRASFNRVTEAARVGWLTGNVLAGGPSGLDRELDALRPAFAVIMLGTNDNRPGGFEPFSKNLAEVVDRALARGVVPLLSTIPPRADNAFAAARVPEFNAVIRSLAESRQVPLMDLYSALLPLRSQGLSSDGVHLTVAGKGSPRGCLLTPAGLRQGMNVRNLVTLTALDRARRFVLEGEAPEAEGAEAVAMVETAAF